jgi:carnitine 3-dehydrogenase
MKTAGLLGGGVIGGGWAARFLLNGIDVRLYDPDPEAERKVSEVLANARRATRNLMLAPLPAEGRLTLVATPEEAAEGVEFVQESAPERVDLKQRLLGAASRAAGPDVVFGSSTSGLRPTLLQAEMEHPQRLCVGHPFNPVYLLPLVEVVGGEQTTAETCEQAAAIYREIGMHPLLVRTEIDGFIADRLLEAIWREALWMVADGVATTEEIDDAMRYGAGLRFASMGTFLIYRIAGGEAGMRHFMAQFGPALQWPWSRLTDVPELTDDLLDRLATQSDEQAAGASIRELEQLRDDCLVAVLQGLRTRGYAAGAIVAGHERALLDRVHPTAAETVDEARPLELHRAVVPPEWTDYNGHLHESRYLQILGDGSDALFRYVGIDAAYLDEAGNYFTVETHLRFRAELSAGDAVTVAIQLLAADAKRIHAWLELRRDDGTVAATAEHMYLHVDAATHRAGPAREDVLANVRRIAAAHETLPRPDAAGATIGIR